MKSEPRPPMPRLSIYWSWTIYGSRYSKNGGHFHDDYDMAKRRITSKRGQKRMGGEIYKLINDARHPSPRWKLVASHDGKIDSEIKFLY
jgi:hypothetical protein